MRDALAAVLGVKDEAGDGHCPLGGVIGIYVMSWMSTRWRLTDVVAYLSLAAAICMAIFAAAPNQLTVLMTLIFLIGILQQGGFTVLRRDDRGHDQCGGTQLATQRRLR